MEDDAYLSNFSTDSLEILLEEWPEKLRDLHDLSYSTPKDVAVIGPNEEDGYARALAPTAYERYQAANQAYRKYPKRVLEFIPLNSVRRTSSYQSEFYEKFLWHRDFGGAKAPAANRPGTSSHEYGFAADVGLAQDAKVIKDELNAAGWVDDKPGEAWHFEARSASAYKLVQAYIASKAVQDVAAIFRDALVQILKKRKQYQDGKAAYERDLSGIEAERTALLRERSTLEARRRTLQETAARLRRDRMDIEADRRMLRTLQARIANMRYDRCPNGNDFPNCDHPDLKDGWLRDKTRLEQEVATLQQDIHKRISQLQIDDARHQKDVAAFNADMAVFQGKQAQYEQRKADFETLYKDIIALLDALAAWENDKIPLLANVQAAVDAAPK